MASLKSKSRGLASPTTKHKSNRISKDGLSKKTLKNRIKRVDSDCRSRKPAPSSKKTKLPLPFIGFETKITPGRLELQVPIRTVSEANNFDHWTKKRKRHKTQQKLIFFALLNCKHLVKFPCMILFIRYAPKTLDKHDNLPMSLKWVVDSTCSEITNEHRPGLADNFKYIDIHYDQVISKQYYIKIIITF
jgi:hypothetical protein